MVKRLVICGWWLVTGLSVAAMPAADGFRAGFSRRDITPPFGVFMPGYYQERHAKSVLDPLQINMVAFSDGRRTALVAQFDTEALSDYVADALRDEIVRATGVERDAILLHASHTHDGGFLAMKRARGAKDEANPADDGVPSFGGEVDEVYRSMVMTRAADAAVEAIRDLKPARLSIGRSTASRISFGRRYLMKNGKVQTNPGTNNPEIVRPVGTADETVQVLRIDREGAKAICLINFQTHPDVVGGETITADWPGLTRTVFEAATMGGANCMVINGTEGDVNHCNVLPRPGELNGLRRDFDAVDRGYDHARHMANVIVAAALNVWLKCVPVEAGEIRFAKREIRVPANKAKDTDEKNLAWAKDVWTLHQKAEKDGVVATPKDYVTVKYGWKDMELTTEVARAGRIIRMAAYGDHHLIPVWGLAIGEVAFGGFPGEPFNDIGVAIRKKSPFKLTILSCLTNGSRGYFPFSDSYEQGGYESATSPFGPTVADDLIAGELELLRGIRR